MIDQSKSIYGHYTALIKAAEERRKMIVVLLLEKGAKVDANKHPEVMNARTDIGYTPLYLARRIMIYVLQRHNHIVNWLIREKGVTR